MLIFIDQYNISDCRVVFDLINRFSQMNLDIELVSVTSHRIVHSDSLTHYVLMKTTKKRELLTIFDIKQQNQSCFRWPDV